MSPASDSDGFLIQVPSQHGLLIFPPNSSLAGDVTMVRFVPLVPSHPVPAALLLPPPNYSEPFFLFLFLFLSSERNPSPPELGEEKRKASGLRAKRDLQVPDWTGSGLQPGPSSCCPHCWWCSRRCCWRCCWWSFFFFSFWLSVVLWVLL